MSNQRSLNDWHGIWRDEAPAPTPLASRRDPEITRLRQQLDGSERARALYLHDLTDRDATIATLRRENAALRRQMARGGIAWYEWAIVTLIVAWERLGRAWVSLLGEDRHERWTGKIAALVGAVAFFAAVFLGGGR